MTPIRIKVDPAHDASKVKAEGPGLSRSGTSYLHTRSCPPSGSGFSQLLLLSGVELNKPTHFTVSTKGAGKANLDCSFSGPTKAEAVKDVEIINNHDNTHTVKYTPVQQVQLTCIWIQRSAKSGWRVTNVGPLVLRVLLAWL